MSVDNPWQVLSNLERRLLAPKLLLTPPRDREFNDVEFDTAAEEFLRGIRDEFAAEPESESIIAERLLTVRNFMAQTGAYRNSLLWRQIQLFRGFRSSYIELLVEDRDELMRVLADARYVINREPPWSIHRFDSARAPTRFSSEPSLHFANDRADEPDYGPNYFFVHWDATSVWFEQARGWLGRLPGGHWIERLRAARKHNSGFADPGDVRGYLDELNEIV
jgi:hypothetical protein